MSDKIVGIDLGFRWTGIAVAQYVPARHDLEMAVAETYEARAMSDSVRIDEIARMLLRTFERYEPFAVAVEVPAFGCSNNTTLRRQYMNGMQRGMMIGMAAAWARCVNPLPLLWVLPAQVKEASAAVLLAWPEWGNTWASSDHAWDAAAAILVARRTREFDRFAGSIEEGAAP